MSHRTRRAQTGRPKQSVAQISIRTKEFMKAGHASPSLALRLVSSCGADEPGRVRRAPRVTVCIARGLHAPSRAGTRRGPHPRRRNHRGRRRDSGSPRWRIGPIAAALHRSWRRLASRRPGARGTRFAPAGTAHRACLRRTPHRPLGPHSGARLRRRPGGREWVQGYMLRHGHARGLRLARQSVLSRRAAGA